MNTDPNILILLANCPEGIARVREAAPGAKVVLGPWIQDAGKVLPREMLQGVDVLYCELPPENFDDFDRLRWIQVTSSGYTQVLNLPIVERGIRVTNGLGTFDVPIAEWNLMMILWWHRNMPDSQENQRRHIWDRAPKFERELRGSTVGFYGYGGIARETARMAKTLGLRVWALSRGRPEKRGGKVFCLPGTGDPDGVLPDRHFTSSQTAEFLAGLDYLVITVPLTAATRGVIAERELRQLKPSAVLLNCARGPIVEEQSLLRCMRERWIRGAAIDVHYAYPLPPEHALWDMPNVILTPHIAGGSGGEHFLPRSFTLFAENVRRFCAGENLLNELSREQLEGR